VPNSTNFQSRWCKRRRIQKHVFILNFFPRESQFQHGSFLLIGTNGIISYRNSISQHTIYRCSSCGNNDISVCIRYLGVDVIITLCEWDQVEILESVHLIKSVNCFCFGDATLFSDDTKELGANLTFLNKGWNENISSVDHWMTRCRSRHDIEEYDEVNLNLVESNYHFWW
jgi:hypothetical protein